MKTKKTVKKTDKKSSNKTVPIIIIVAAVVLAGVILGVKFLADKPNGGNENSDLAFQLTGDKLDIEKLKSYGLPIIIGIGQDWEPTCQQQRAILKELYSELEGRAIILSVDAEKNPKTTELFTFPSLPAQNFINADGTPYKPLDAKKYNMYYVYGGPDGKEVTHTMHAGIMGKEVLMQVLKEMGMKNAAAD
ncbi:MAG: thioredoxin family protein [Acutalibacteraceae bacterium]|jgi:thioredoxin 1